MCFMMFIVIVQIVCGGILFHTAYNSDYYCHDINHGRTVGHAISCMGYHQYVHKQFFGLFFCCFAQSQNGLYTVIIRSISTIIILKMYWSQLQPIEIEKPKIYVCLK